MSSSTEEEFIKYMHGSCEYREFQKRKYMNALSQAIKDGDQLDLGARLSVLINYFRAGKWCHDCLKFVLSRLQCEIIVPKYEHNFKYEFYLCPDCFKITKSYLEIHNN